jgi:hypothetical protein
MAFRKSRQAIQKRAKREGWAREDGVFTMDVLPADVAKQVREYRESQTAISVQLTHEDCGVLRHEKLPTDYSQEQQDLGRARSKYVLAVEEELAARPGLETPEAVRAVVIRAEQQHPHPYAALTTAGKEGHSALALDGWPRCPAYENFYRWTRKWKPFRKGARDSYQWWALCDRYKDGAEKVKALYETKLRSGEKGDPRCWTAFRELYVHRNRLTFEEAYRDMDLLARKNGWAPVPDRYTVKYYYRIKLSEMERRQIAKVRDGGKHHYDKLHIYIRRQARDARRWVNACWIFDHHNLRIACKRYVESVGGYMFHTPWLTNAVDFASYFEVGRHFTHEPSRDSIDFAVRSAIEHVGGCAPWFYFDNGKDFRSIGMGLGYDQERVMELGKRFGVHCKMALPHNPRAKLEQDYRYTDEWFERKFPTYMGHDQQHLQSIWPKLRGMVQTDERGRLLYPDLLPTMEQVAASYVRWRMDNRHHRASEGRILQGQSPVQRYTAGAPLNPLPRISEAELATAFLRDVKFGSRKLPLQQVDQCGRLRYRPPSGKRWEEIFYRSDALLPFNGRKVLVRIDVTTMRLFAFEVRNGDTHMIKCDGPFGSVPLEREFHPFEAPHEQIKERLKYIRGLERADKKGAEAHKTLNAMEELAREYIGTTLPSIARIRQARAFAVPTGAGVDRAAEHKQQDEELQKVLADIPDDPNLKGY